MPRGSSDSRRFTPTEAEPNGWSSSDSDAVIVTVNEHGSPHSSPVKARPSARSGSRSSSPTKPYQRAPKTRAEGRDAAASSNITLPGGTEIPGIFKTPTRNLKRYPSTTESRASSARKHFAGMVLDSPSALRLANYSKAADMDITPKRLFHDGSTPSKSSTMIVISDSEDDHDSKEAQEMAEVNDMLTDTENEDAPKALSLFPKQTETSLSSIGSSTFAVTRDSSFTSIGSSGSVTFQTNRAATLTVTTTVPPSPTKGSPIKGPRPSKATIKKKVTEALSPSVASRTLRVHTRASVTPAAAETTRTTHQKSTSNMNKGKAPIKRGSPMHVDASTSAAATTAPSQPAKAQPSAALVAFLKLNIGSNLESVAVCHDSKVQRMMDDAKIEWGVQYELARGVLENNWKWEDVASKISNLKGTNAQVAARVKHIMKGRVPKAALDTALWEELDREQAAIIEDIGRGLGCMGEWKGANPWWGGQIQQLARLDRNGDSYQIFLEPMEKRRCHRLARFLGSRRVLQLRINSELVMKENDKLLKFLSQKFVICGRTFVPLSSKDNGVYLVEVNEDYDRRPSHEMGDQHRRSLSEIIHWANPLEYNFGQPISKWSTRFALALSNSVPALEFDEENIHELDDLYAPSYDGKKKAAAEQILTDGCGFMNEAALKRIQTFLGFDFRPTAVQGRIKGAKGLWTLHPSNNDTEPKIWLRKSQIKIELETPLHRSQRIFDLLAISRPSSSVSLSAQTIMNLSFNGVPDQTLIEMLEKGLREEVEPLMKWEGPHAMQILYDTVCKLGGVTRARAVRVAGAASRAAGLERRDWGHEDVEMKDPKEAVPDPDDVDDAAESAHTGRNPHSGTPLSLHELAAELIQACFKPQEFEYLKEKLRYIMELHIKSIVEKYNIPLSLAVNNYVIPDPCGVLEAGEVYYRSSSALIDPVTQNSFNIFKGPVLIGRYPVRLPSDVQKLQAVDHPILAQYPDVLILSTKGQESVASLLSGGDYDGDECFVFADPNIVDPFESKPLSKEPSSVKEDFKPVVTLIETFVADLDGQVPDAAFARQLLLGLHDSKKGIYSTFHDMAVWKHGYDHRQAIKLAYMFNTLLDSGKTGLRLKDHVFARDQKDFGGKIPTLTELENQQKRWNILHKLANAGLRIGKELRGQFGAFPSSDAKDHDLLRPYTDALSLTGTVEPAEIRQFLRAERERIQEHVKAAHEQWQVAIGQLRRDDSPTKKKGRFQRTKSDPMGAVARSYTSKIDGVYLFQDTRLIKASYAYELKPAFALQVAFIDLCEIKAKTAAEGYTPIGRAFDEAKGVTSSYLRAVASISSTD